MNEISTNLVTFNKNGYTSALYFIPESGKIIYRDKVDTLIGIKHPGIILGKDAWGDIWVIHNHYQIGYPQIVKLNEFADGNLWFYDNRPVFYNTIDIVKRAIHHFYQRNQYHWLFNNCQHFVNEVTQNDSYSETIDNVSNNALIGGGLLTLFGALCNNKALVQTGLTIAGTGVAGKVLNRIK